MNEKKALKEFTDLLQETSASSTISMSGAGKDKSSKSTPSVNKKTQSDIKKNKEVGKNQAKAPSTSSTSKTDSESDSSEGSDNKQTRKSIEQNNKTKKFSFPGR